MIKFHEPYKSEKLQKNLNYLYEKNTFGSTYFRDSCTEILKDKFGYSNFLLTNSATSALELSAMLLKDYGYKKVKMPSYTFSSTANAFLRSGYELEFLDIEIDNLMVNIDKLEKLNDSEIFAFVHYAGSSIDFDKIFKKLGKDVKFVEDAAQAFGVKYNNVNTGQFGLTGCISFHPTKNIHSGFGGMAIINNNLDFDKAKYIYERGTDRSKVISGLKNKYEWVELGSSFEITEASCAILESQLLDYEIIYQKRKEIFYEYANGLKNLISDKKMKIQRQNQNVAHNYHAFYIIVDKDRDRLLEYLGDHGIQAYIGYVPLHSSTFSINNQFNRVLEDTDYISERVIRLPIHTNLSIDDIKYVCKKLNDFYYENS